MEQENGDERIRKRAYELWEKENRPEGKEKEHWAQAERELSESERNGEAPPEASPSGSESETTVGIVAEVPVRKKRSEKRTPKAPLARTR
jgi:hypothetical protein